MAEINVYYYSQQVEGFTSEGIKKWVVLHALVGRSAAFRRIPCRLGRHAVRTNESGDMKGHSPKVSKSLFSRTIKFNTISRYRDFAIV